MSDEPSKQSAATSSTEGRLIAAGSLPTGLTGFLAAWFAFWLLLATVDVQDHLRKGHVELWKPLLWEGSSFVVASLLVWALWRYLPHLDRWLRQPPRWFAIPLIALVPIAPLFVASVYSLRHLAYAFIGQLYIHDPWPVVFRYEIVKFAMFYLLFVAVFFGMRSYAAMTAERLRAEQALAATQHAQLLQLTQQIEPHFLFNALNTIAATIHSDPTLADTLLTQLAALLRATTNLSQQPTLKLHDEWQLLNSYAAIMCQRFADRVTVRFSLDETACDCLVPSLLLQPLLENAFRHGVERQTGAALIIVEARREKSMLIVAVSDDIGSLPSTPILGTGLSNAQQRLASMYGNRATLTLRSLQPRGVVARVELPCE